MKCFPNLEITPLENYYVKQLSHYKNKFHENYLHTPTMHKYYYQQIVVENVLIKYKEKYSKITL